MLKMTSKSTARDFGRFTCLYHSLLTLFKYLQNVSKFSEMFHIFQKCHQKASRQASLALVFCIIFCWFFLSIFRMFKNLGNMMKLLKCHQKLPHEISENLVVCSIFWCFKLIISRKIKIFGNVACFPKMPSKSITLDFRRSSVLYHFFVGSL